MMQMRKYVMLALILAIYHKQVCQVVQACMMEYEYENQTSRQLRVLLKITNN